MSLAEIAAMLAAMNIDYAYRQFDSETGKQPPFICYFFGPNVPEAADNINYAKIETLNIELYTDYKDFNLEAQVEAVLDSCEMVYFKDEDWIESEKMHMTIYTMEVLING